MKLKKYLAAMLLCMVFVPAALAEVIINAANFPDATFRSYVS